VKMHILRDFIEHLGVYASSENSDWFTLMSVANEMVKHTRSLEREIALFPRRDSQRVQNLESPPNTDVSRILQNIDKEFAELARRAWSILHPQPATN